MHCAQTRLLLKSLFGEKFSYWIHAQISFGCPPIKIRQTVHPAKTKKFTDIKNLTEKLTNKQHRQTFTIRNLSEH